MTDSRWPLAFRPTADLRAALECRAQAAGVDVDDRNAFAAWAGDLIAEALPEVVAERLRATSGASTSGASALVNPDGEP